MEDRSQQGLHEGNANTCPLCHGQMQARTRDPLLRMLGFLVLYASCFSFLWLLPRMRPSTGLTLGALAVWGIFLMRSAPTKWCPGCWFERADTARSKRAHAWHEDGQEQSG